MVIVGMFWSSTFLLSLCSIVKILFLVKCQEPFFLGVCTLLVQEGATKLNVSSLRIEKCVEEFYYD